MDFPKLRIECFEELKNQEQQRQQLLIIRMLKYFVDKSILNTDDLKAMQKEYAAEKSFLDHEEDDTILEELGRYCI